LDDKQKPAAAPHGKQKPGHKGGMGNDERSAGQLATYRRIMGPGGVALILLLAVLGEWVGVAIALAVAVLGSAVAVLARR
jgi:hypothetical protein